MMLSLIIPLLDPQAPYLPACLEMLRRQTFADFEVLILGPEAPTELQPDDFWHWQSARGNAQALLNQGAKLSQGDILVFLSPQLLLNPQALESIDHHLYSSHHARRLWLGYFGQSWDYISSSQWFPELPVHYISPLFQGYSPYQFQPSSLAQASAYTLVHTDYLALPRFFFNELQGFNSQLPLLDSSLELGWRAFQAGAEYFSGLSAWAEKGVIPTQAPPDVPEIRSHSFKFPPQPPPAPLQFPLSLLEQAAQVSHCATLFAHYIQQDPHLPPHYKQVAQKTEVQVQLNTDYPRLIQSGYRQRIPYPEGPRPNFLIIGAYKAGTTTLFNYLSLHPQLSPAVVKELHFFNREAAFRQGIEAYLDNFVFEPNQLTFEATPHYLDHPQCAKRISEVFPTIKLIVLLRNPVAQVFSAWNMRFNKRAALARERGENSYNLRQMLTAALAGDDPHDLLRTARYNEHLNHYCKYFAPQAFLLLNFEDLVNNPKYIWKQVTQFLQISALPNQNLPYFHLNPGNYLESFPEDLQAALISYYAPYNQALKNQWKLDFDWLKEV